MGTQYISLFGIVSVIICVEGTSPVIMSDNTVLTFPEDNAILPPGFNKTWVWRRATGMWGVKFVDVRLDEGDLLIVDDSSYHPLFNPHHQRNVLRRRLDTTGPYLNITLKVGGANKTGRGFKLDVRHGEDTLDLNSVFLNAKTTPQPVNTDLNLVLPLLIAITTIILFLFLTVLTLFFCHRRRRRRHQQVSLSVNVNSGIRRESGVKYTRKPSTQSQQEEPQSPTRKTSQLSRSNSNRSWMVRAELMATTTPGATSSMSGSCNEGGRVHAQPNFYIPSDALVTGQGQTKQERRLALEGKVYCGRANETFRPRLQTLEQVPEYKQMSTIPAPPSSMQQDGGYLAMRSHSLSSPSYLNSEVFEGEGENKQVHQSSRTGSCADGYQNITVTGTVGIV